MLYQFLKIIIQITTKVFFRKIEVRNKELIPAKGPMIICANHPSTFMDPIVIAAQLKRPVFFLSKASVFKSPIAKWLLPKLNMIPLYRQQDDPTLVHKNEDSFRACYAHLEKGGAIMIFPEGVSLAERNLKPIKTGAVRIALGAEARNSFSLGVKIVPVGLNYQNSNKFNQNLFMNMGEPIVAADFKAEYEKDSFKAVHLMTEQLTKKLRSLIIDIEDNETDILVHRIEEVYKPKILKEASVKSLDQHENFIVTKNIVETVRYYKDTNLPRVERVKKMVESYFINLGRVGLNHQKKYSDENKNSLPIQNIKAILFIVIGFPFYLYGLINNYLPFEIPSRLAKRFSPDKEFESAISMTLGIFTFVLFYTFQIYWVAKLTDKAGLTLLYAFTLPVFGFFTYYYWHTLEAMRSAWKLVNLFYKRSALVAGLIQQRKEIIMEFDKAREERLSH